MTELEQKQLGATLWAIADHSNENLLAHLSRQIVRGNFMS